MELTPVRIKWLAAAITLVLVSGIFVTSWLLVPVPEEYVAPVVEEPEPEPEPVTSVESMIGTSVEGRAINAITFGEGDTHLLFVGGMHGGYEWNSVLLAYQFIDYLDANSDVIPPGLKVSIIPKLNPDGVFAVGLEGRFSAADVPADAPTAPGRFNANEVDLNRNFDCKWQPESSWRGATVSAGTAPFSEPEAAALRDFVLKTEPDAVGVWHSQANTVYASECEDGVLPKTLEIMDDYANAASYNSVASFDAYPVTGDAEG